MPMALTASVGLGGNNIRSDVITVQTLLALRGQRPGTPDGICGQRTIAAIRGFQATFMRMPDGLISAHGPTWQRLNSGTPGGHSGGPHVPTIPTVPGVPGAGGSLTDTVPRPAQGTFNVGLTAISNTGMKGLFGMPRDSFSQDCQPVTNAVLKRNVASDTVGKIRVTGLRPAIDSLKQVFGEIATALPQVHAVIGTAGMLCCRFQRGSATAISNHSWGTAIDLTINGVLDKRGDNKVQIGLLQIAPIFNKHGWYWGAMFGAEDAMHFEASLTLAQKFKTQFA